ncbi:arylsulfatase [Tautonia sociabilis]|uniref:Arylsulfatase n=1 Tax=Tautonia sociabilis TaxID=2080755 RepID=A0A432ML04_9BACT|nr:arylsulfatase [Tautonia sociabilis]RUL87815.1 arylsulfatase [Tautonia sociabilis]
MPRRSVAHRLPGHRVRPLALAFALALLAAPEIARPEPADAPAPERPNIVIIMADDLGFSDLGCFGGEIETPNLDRLAANGLRLSQFYNTARCCPTRASLLTGLYSHRAGIGHMVGDYGLPSYQGYLNDRCVTIAEALRPAGYATLMAGKWHVGSDPGRWPLDRGFDRYFGTPTGGGVYFKETLQIRKEVFFVADDRRVAFPDDAYVTDLFTDHAIRFVRDASQGDRPFFLYLAHIAPHWPLQALPEDIEKYRGRYDDLGWDTVRSTRYRRQIELGLIDPAWPLSPRDPEAVAWRLLPDDRRAELAFRMAVYAAQVDRIDQSVGRLVSALEEAGELENTVILFLSDNGCSAEGGPGGFSRGEPGAPIGTGSSYASVGLEWANASDTPFRKFKMSVHEGGIASPFIVHWPAGLSREGEIEHQPGHVIDLLPTCLELAGASYPAERNGQPTLPLDGRSLVPAFAGEPIDRGPLFWEHQGNRAVRLGEWKLVAPHGKPWELYDLESDRTELVDLSDTMPEKVAELSALWQSWANRAGVAPWPVRRD